MQHVWQWSMPYGQMLGRIGVATVLAALIGYERDVHGRPAGLRTHAIVGLASAMFMVVSTHFVYYQHYALDHSGTPSDHLAIDASRIASAVVSGVGFLAGGAILRTGLNVQGLTTAAGLWLVAAIGLSVGGGMYELGVTGTGIGLIALTLLRRLEDKDDKIVRRRITLEMGDEARMATVLRGLTELGASVTRTNYEKHVETHSLAVTLDVSVPRLVDDRHLMNTIETEPGVRRIRIENAA